MTDNVPPISTPHILDARYQLCPMPVINMQKMIKTLGIKAIGEEIQTICTDPGAMHDIPAWARVHGHEVLNSHQKDDEFIITIKICDDT